VTRPLILRHLPPTRMVLLRSRLRAGPAPAVSSNVVGLPSIRISCFRLRAWTRRGNAHCAGSPVSSRTAAGRPPRTYGSRIPTAAAMSDIPPQIWLALRDYH
jgi:hypothetical protein